MSNKIILPKGIVKSLVIVLCILVFPLNIYAIPLGLSTFEQDEILNKVIPSPAIAVVNQACELRQSTDLLSKNVGEIEAGVTVEILQDKSYKWYLIRNFDLNVQGWVLAKYLDIEQDPATITETMDELEIEAFAQYMDFPSNTNYLIWTDIARQLTHVFVKEGLNWTLSKTIVCATGKNESPTTRGFFTVTDKGTWFYSNRLQSGAKFWTKFNGAYLFHSVAMDKNKNILDDVLGERRSSGCIRMSVEDAQWIYLNIPEGTSVFVY